MTCGCTALAAQTVALTVFPCTAWDSQGAIFNYEDTVELSRDMLKNDRKSVYSVSDYSALGRLHASRLLLCVSCACFRRLYLLKSPPPPRRKPNTWIQS